jgi:hypothetical protein
MTPLLISVLCLAMVGTSFLSGIFGMAGGMILVGILLVLLPVPEAMMLHGVTQMARSAGGRCGRHVRWSASAYLRLCFAPWRVVPPCRAAQPRTCSAQRRSWRGWAEDCPNPGSLLQERSTAAPHARSRHRSCGPLIDSFFLGGKLDRREIVPTTVCQIFGHAGWFISAAHRSAGSVDPLVAALAIQLQ